MEGMTDLEWQTCRDPAALLASLEGRISERKLRLFACACCRRVWDLISDRLCRELVELAERVADSQTAVEELEDALDRAHRSQPLFGSANRAALLVAMAQMDVDVAVECARQAARFLAYKACMAHEARGWAAVRAGARRSEQEAAWANYDDLIQQTQTAEAEQQAELLRELLPGPEQPPAPPPEWSGAILRLAEALYGGEDCAFALHDALLEAGQPDLAAHFADGVHPKGCWALDRILGRD